MKKKIIYTDVYKRLTRKEKKEFGCFFTIWKCDTCKTIFQVEKGLGGFRNFECPCCGKITDIHFGHLLSMENYNKFIYKKFPVYTGEQKIEKKNLFASIINQFSSQIRFGQRMHRSL